MNFKFINRIRIEILLILFIFQVAGVSATTEHQTAPPVLVQGVSSLPLADEHHMSIAATENAG